MEHLEAGQHSQRASLVKAMAGYFSGPFGGCRCLYYVTREIASRMERLKHGEAVSITS